MSLASRDRLLLAVERDHAGDRAEDLLARGAVVVGRPARARSAGTSSPGPSGALPRIATGASSGTKEATVSRWPAEISGPICGRLVERVADPHRLDRALERLHEVVDRRALDQDPRARAAVLAGVAEHRQRRRRGGRLEVGVGEDDVGRLAAQLERHPLDRRRGARGDPAADLGRAGEGDLGDVGVLDQPLRRRRCPGPATTFSTPSGSPASSAIRSSSSAVSGVSSAGFSTTVLPAASAGADLPGGDRQREVPGHDQADDAERLAEGHVDAAGDRDRVPEQPLRRAGVVAEGLDDHPDLAAGVADRLAGVARLEHAPAPRACSSSASARPCSSAARSRRRDRAPGREGRLRARRPRRRSPRPRPAAPRPSPRSVAGSIDLDHVAPPTSARAPPRPAPRSPGCARPPRGARARRGRSAGPGSSIASIRSSSADQPVTTRPSPSLVDALVVVRLDRDRAPRPPRARRASPARAARRGRRTCPACARWSLVAERVGQVLVERAAAARR